MEFIPAANTNDAKEVNVVRFMHIMGKETVYWLQGTIEKRLTKYKIAHDCKLIVNNLFQYKRHLAWIIINNLLHKINHHSKNHTSSLDQKSVMAKKNPRSRCRLCGSASTGLAFQIFEASLLHTIPFHPLQLQPCCPNSRPQGVDDPFYDSRSLGSAISQSAVSKPIKYT